MPERRVVAVGWRGSATVTTPDRTLDLAVETRVEPFRRARSRSWITAQGEASARTLVIEPGDGWLERGGKREPMPAALVAHERQQYGMYGYLLWAMQARGEAAASLVLREPGFPEARFQLDNGWPVAADYRVDPPEAGKPSIAERFTFTGMVADGAFRWPKGIAIAQDGRRFFELRIEHLSVDYA